MLIALAVLGGLGLGLVVVLRWMRRRTYFVPLRMSDAWLAAHAADPAPDHLR